MITIAIRIIATCPKCGNQAFDNDTIVNGRDGLGWGYACTKCGENIGDDAECWPLKYELVV